MKRLCIIMLCVLQSTTALYAAGLETKKKAEATVSAERKQEAELEHRDGTPDTNFGKDGKVIVDFDNKMVLEKLLVQPDGSMIGIGYDIIETPVGISHKHGKIFRLTREGELDKSFSVTISQENETYLKTGALLPDGSIIVAGEYTDRSYGRSNNIWLLAKITPQGQLDPKFGTQGILIHNMHKDAHVTTIATQPDGGIIVGGHSSGGTPRIKTWEIARYTQDGKVDEAFRSRALATHDKSYEGVNGVEGQLNCVLALPDGSIMVGGELDNRNSTMKTGRICRVTGQGDLDQRFGDNEGSLLFKGQVTALASQGDAIIVGAQGQRELYYAIARCSREGKFDEKFGKIAPAKASGSRLQKVDPSVILDIPEAHSVQVVVDQQGRIIVFNRKRIYRYCQEAQLDDLFGDKGMVKLPVEEDLPFGFKTITVSPRYITVGGMHHSKKCVMLRYHYDYGQRVRELTHETLESVIPASGVRSLIVDYAVGEHVKPSAAPCEPEYAPGDTKLAVAQQEIKQQESKQKENKYSEAELKAADEALFVALFTGGDAINKALAQGARLTTRQGGKTPLMIAVEQNLPVVVQQLLTMPDVKTFIDLQDRADETALIKAVKANKIELVRMLLDAGANIFMQAGAEISESTKKTALEYAADKPAILQLLKNTIKQMSQMSETE